MVPDSQRAGETLAQTVHSGPVRLALPALLVRVAAIAGFVLAPVSPHAYGLPYQGPFNGPVQLGGLGGRLHRPGGASRRRLIALLAARDRRAWPFLGCAAAGLLLASRFLPLAHLL